MQFIQHDTFIGKLCAIALAVVLVFSSIGFADALPAEDISATEEQPSTGEPEVAETETGLSTDAITDITPVDDERAIVSETLLTASTLGAFLEPTVAFDGTVVVENHVAGNLMAELNVVVPDSEGSPATGAAVASKTHKIVNLTIRGESLNTDDFTFLRNCVIGTPYGNRPGILETFDISQTATTEIPDGAFYFGGAGTSDKLKTVVLPETATSIGENAFYRHIALSSMNLSHVVSIGASAFYNTAFTSLDLASLTTLGTSAFQYGGSVLSSINAPLLESVPEKAFYPSSSGSNTSLTFLYLPKATSIGAEAFYKYTALTQVDLPYATELGASSFYGCTSLTKIYIPQVQIVGKSALYNCTSLQFAVFGGGASKPFCYVTPFTGVPYAAGSAALALIPTSWGDTFTEWTRTYDPYRPTIAYNSLPESASVFVGEAAEFSADITTSGVGDFQWSHNGTPIDGATSATLSIEQATLSDAGEYVLSFSYLGNTYALAFVTLDVESVAVEEIDLNVEDAVLDVLDEITLEATVLPANASNPAVTWTSSDPQVAQVDAQGKVTALKDGTAFITVTSDDDEDIFAVCEITVNPVTLSVSSDSIEVGDDFSVVPSVDGGTWSGWDTTIISEPLAVVFGTITPLSAVSAASFTALAPGTTTVTYSVANATATTAIDIAERQAVVDGGDKGDPDKKLSDPLKTKSRIPATGDATGYAFIVLGVLFLLGTAFSLVYYRMRYTKQ